MAKRKPRKQAQRIKVLKILKVEPDKHVVELEIHGAPELPAEVQLPTEPLEIHAPEVQETGFVAWWKSLW